MNYWEECIRESFEESGIGATKEQIDIVVSWVEGAHENYGVVVSPENERAGPGSRVAEIVNNRKVISVKT